MRLGAPREPCLPPPLPSFPHQPWKARIKPLGCPFHSSERHGESPGSQQPQQSEDRNPISPQKPLTPGPPGKVGLGMHWPSTCLSPRESLGLCLGPQGSAGLQWVVSVPVWGLTQAPDLGRPTADCIPALPPASCVVLGKSLYLSMPVSS